MESNGGEDDQGSGWMQVKKKHRSNSKCSLHHSIGELVGLQSSSYSRNKKLFSRKTENSKVVSQPSVTSKAYAVPDAGNTVNSISSPVEDDLVDCYLDKCVVSQDNLKLDSSHLESISIQDSSRKLIFNEGISSNTHDLPKFKWGDLDEGTLTHYRKISGGEVRSQELEDQNLVCAKPGSAGELWPGVDTEENRLVTEATHEVQILPKSHSLSPKNIFEEEISVDVNEVSSEDIKEQIMSEEIVSQIISISFDHEYFDMENADSTDPSGKIIGGKSTEEETIRKEANSKPMLAEPSISVQPVPDIAPSTGLTTLYSEPLVPENIECRDVGESSIEESGAENCKLNSEDFAEAQDTDAIISDVTDECKERFRERLWCFLFENLNRAVDELYLLCELECDLDQMKEASLVLEEAASDFNELKCRVEKFEKLKRSSSHEIDDARLTLQSDHRRPHALSWEVRRMTTSPSRAEILSSSLEAFRKIQQVRSSECENNSEKLKSDFHSRHSRSSDIFGKSSQKNIVNDSKELDVRARTQPGLSDISLASAKEKRNLDSVKSGSVASRLHPREGPATCANRRSNRELHGSACDREKLLLKNEKISIEQTGEKDRRLSDSVRKNNNIPEREREKRNGSMGKSMDAWKEKRNWEELLASPHRVSSRFSYSPGISRKSAERARVLHDKLMSPEKKKKSTVDLKKEAEEKHARATRIRIQLENERVQKLQRTSEKLNRVSEWQTVRSNKLRESMFARHQRSESRHEAYLAQVVRRAGDESSKVNEVRFITSLNEENKKHILRKKLQDSELRRAEKLQTMKTKQKEDMAREEAVLERKRLIEVEKLQRLAETQRRKEEAQVRREEERKASSAAREAKAMEQMRKKEVLAKARQEEAELLAQKLAERLSESEQRRKIYLEQIRERASMDFRDQSSPSLRRFSGKEGHAQGRSAYVSGEDNLANKSIGTVGSGSLTSEAFQHSLKRRIKNIRQKLMSLKHDFPEPSLGPESSGIGYRTAVGTARGKICRWLQDLQKLRQARKDGAATFGLITAEMIKFLVGRDAELHAARQVGLLDFIASALPASHTSKPEACQVTIYLLRLLRVVLIMPANRCYFLVQNLLPPLIPMLAAALENYIKMAASSNSPGPTNSISSKISGGTLDLVSEVVEGFLWTVGAIIGHLSCTDLQVQMQDGLVELVIAYQIIHLLRDLFALYDRPQAEGSPFPPSILLSIDLLVVLTSKFRVSSSIDWEYFPHDVINEFKLEKSEVSGSAGERSTSCNSCGDNSSFSPAMFSLPENLRDVPGSMRLAEEIDNPILKNQNQIGPICHSGETVYPDLVCDNSQDIDLVAPQLKTIDVLCESLRTNADDKCEQSIKDGSISASLSAGLNNGSDPDLKQPAMFLLSAMSETGLVCLPSLLTAVLLQANNRLSAEQSLYVLPSNFEEVAAGVLKVLNNLALIDVAFIQKMLSRPDLKMEFFHLMSFLLSHCTSNWGITTDKIGLLLLETLSLLGFFSLFHPENQAVLRWGKSPTILHKVCDLPFVFFSDPELMPVLAGTLVAASYGCELNKAVIQQELSMDMLLPSLRSCKSISPVIPVLVQDGPLADDSSESNQMGPESRKLPPEASHRLSRAYLRNGRVLSQRGSGPAGGIRTVKSRNQRDNKISKPCEEPNVQSASDTLALMLHCRFPLRFIEKAEHFFTAETNTRNEQLG